LIALSIIAIGLSACVQLAGTSLLWGNMHSGTPAMTQQLVLQACVGLGTLGWVVMTPFRWRTRPLEIAALAAVAAGQLSMWQLLLRYGVTREWAPGPGMLLTIAVAGVVIGFGVFVVRPSLDGPGSD
jgi:hypothetical protein